MICTKVKYATEAFAIADIARIAEKSTRKNIPCRAYLCKNCSKWHLTSQREFKEETIIKLRQEITDLKVENYKLKCQINELTNKDMQVIRIEARKNSRIKEMTTIMQNLRAEIKKLRAFNSDLIAKNLHQQQQNNKQQ